MRVEATELSLEPDACDAEVAGALAMLAEHMDKAGGTAQRFLCFEDVDLLRYVVRAAAEYAD